VAASVAQAPATVPGATAPGAPPTLTAPDARDDAPTLF